MRHAVARAGLVRDAEFVPARRKLGGAAGRDEDRGRICIVVAHRPRNVTEVKQIDHFEVTVSAASRVMEVRKLSAAGQEARL